MRTSKAFALVLACFLPASLAGCADNAEATVCGLSMKPQALEPGKTAAIVDEDLLDQHPVLRKIVMKPGLKGGTGEPVECGEGQAVIAALRERGADGRDFHDHGGEAFAEYDGETYVVILGKRVDN